MTAQTETAQTETASVLDEQEVVQALRGLRVAEQQLADAKRGLHAAKDEVAIALHQAAAAYRDPRAPIPHEVIAHLYWERRDIRARDLADAFGIRLSRLAHVAGPRFEEAACVDCGATTEVVRRSRSSTPEAECEDCHRRRAVELELRRLEDEEREARERLEWEHRWGPYDDDPPWRPY